MEALLAFAAALLALRLAGRLAGRWRARRAPSWRVGCVARCLCRGDGGARLGLCGRLNEAAFRLYYLFGGLLTAPLLGAGSLLLVGKRWVIPVALVYVGLAVG